MATTILRRTCAVLVLALAPALAWAAPTAAETKDKEAAASAEKIRQQLDQPMTLEITDQSLNAALKQIREQTKINFVVDKFTLQQLGLDPEQLLVSAKLKDVKARSCLRTVLAPYNLGYAILGDTVLISTDDVVVQRQLKQRVSIDVEKLDLAAALKKLSKDTATNVMLDSRVSEKARKTEVSLQMEDVPLETAVRLLAEVAGLKPVKVGNVYLVTTKAIAGEMRNDPDLNGTGNAKVTVANGDMQLQQQLMMQQFQWQQLQGLNNIQFAPNGPIAIGLNGFGQPQPQGNLPIPPLEKPAEKTDPEDDKPAQPEKKAEPSKPMPK
jgi:type II secretory pathway component GspD/PulD (secretin)